MSSRWLQSAKATVLTMLNSFGGAGVGLVLCYCFYGHTIPVGKMVNCTMGSLVSQTAITFLSTSVESIIIGGISGFIVFLATCMLDSNSKLDDPCCTFIVHGLCGIWGILAVGIFAQVGDSL
jgi:ammonia channel protein AmtB